MQDELRAYVKSNNERVEKLIARGEIIGLVLCLLGVFMMMQRMSFSSHFMIIGISLLAFVYAFHGNFLTEIFALQQKGFMILALRASYMMLAVTTMGILFRLQNWPGGTTMLMIGCCASGICFLFFIYKLYFGKLEDEQLKILINNLIVRMLPALLIVGFLITVAIHG